MSSNKQNYVAQDCVLCRNSVNRVLRTRKGNHSPVLCCSVYPTASQIVLTQHVADMLA
jgi:hypothetical protein